MNVNKRTMESDGIRMKRRILARRLAREVASGPASKGSRRRNFGEGDDNDSTFPEVIEHFQSGGPGWQSRIDAVLREWVKASG